MEIIKTLFGKLKDGKEVQSYTLKNDNGMQVTILDLGGILQSMLVPDENGKTKDVLCGYDNPQTYLDAAGYQGALIGRYCNRIGGARFNLEGKEYTLYVNSGKEDSLHGGKEGFDKKFWTVEPFEETDKVGLALSYISPDMEEGYPGTLAVKVTYTLNNHNALSLHYEATTDKTTVLNLTNHAYFNLSGFEGNSVLSHKLWVDADEYLPVDDAQIPLPEGFVNALNTDFDFTAAHPIAVPIDHSFKLNNYNNTLKKCATVEADGRTLTVYTDLPVLQIYTACVMNGRQLFKKGVPQRPLHAICLETQFAPDSPNRPDFPSTSLKPGEKYDHTTVFSFEK